MKTKDCRCENGELCHYHRRAWGRPAWCGLTVSVTYDTETKFIEYSDKNIRDLDKCSGEKPISSHDWFEEK